MSDATLLVLNPNTSQAMTEAVVSAARALLPPGLRAIGWTASAGPPVIKDRPSYDVAAAAMPALLAEAPRADAILLACFGDPGLAVLRERAGEPVTGLAEAAILAARQRGERFAILTAGAAWVPILTDCVAAGGAAHLLAGVFALDGDGAALRADPERFRAQVRALSARARAAGARRLVPGGAAFEGLRFDWAEGLAVDRPVEAAVALLAHALPKPPA
jgi:Asp/Glu/hydantoin racemase